jgi:hypothetical protein
MDLSGLRRLRAPGRDRGAVMIRLTMLLSRHTRRREFIGLLGGDTAQDVEWGQDNRTCGKLEMSSR